MQGVKDVCQHFDYMKANQQLIGTNFSILFVSVHQVKISNIEKQRSHRIKRPISGNKSKNVLAIAIAGLMISDLLRLKCLFAFWLTIDDLLSNSI